MKMRIVSILFTITVSITTLFLFVSSLDAHSTSKPVANNAQQITSLPVLNYLGQGPDTFTTTLGVGFITKAVGSNTYAGEPCCTITVPSTERVWETDQVISGGITAYHTVLDFGFVAGECIIEYVQIDDDIDTRINRIMLDGNVIHTMTQGMVSYGQFTIPAPGGNVSATIQDSVGILSLPCRQPATPTPTTTNTPLPADTPTATATNTPLPTDTPTATATNTPGPSPTNTPGPSPTNTSEPLPTNTPSSDGGDGDGSGENVTATFTPTPSSTLVATPGIIPALGDGPSSQGTIITSIGLFAVLAVLLVGWFGLWGWKKDAR